MRIAVDAMGGDHAPESVVEGAILALPRCSAALTLIGDEARIEPILRSKEGGRGIEVLHAPECIGMDEAGSTAVRKKREASLSVAMRLLAESGADAVVSAGNTAAVVAAAAHFVGRLPLVRRLALAVPIPAPAGEVLLIDGGAHAEADTVHLVQSAVLADAYLKVTRGLSRPRVGLLNIGVESGKGTQVVQRAFWLLKRLPIGFIGNVEAHEIFADRADAVVCDGFVGNMLLKFFEGVSEVHLKFFEEHRSVWSEQATEDEWVSFRRFQREHYYQNVGGAPLLGVGKTVVVAHGRSRGPAIANAILLASRLAEKRVFERVAEELAKDSALLELKQHYARWMLERWRSRWGFAQKNGPPLPAPRMPERD